ncbi:MAG: glycosyltransferase [Chitinophagaceae bacterium]
MNLVVGIYFHPEAYPPTLNAVGELSDCFQNITIVHRNHMKGAWNFPGNVSVVPSGSLISSVDQENAPLHKKVWFFLQFTASLLRACRNHQPSVILVYDSLSLFAYHLIRPFLSLHKIWYHNHDVTENTVRKFSISWFAARKESQAFKYLDIFSLPTDERLPNFPMADFKGSYFFIPNYPARSFYEPFYHPKKIGQPLRIVFQGSIGPFHGIEEIIPLLKETVNGYNMMLVLKGPCRDEYRKLCIELARKYEVSEKLVFKGVTSYAEVPVVSASCHIGIGILAKQDIMNKTLGTASNKLYEYAAVGLPVIYFNQENFNRYLSKYTWAFAVTLSSKEIKEKISLIIKSYEQLSVTAHQDFLTDLNFEKGFSQVKSFLNTSVIRKVEAN